MARSNNPCTAPITQLTKATNAVKAISIAMTLIDNFSPSEAPLHAASSTLQSVRRTSKGTSEAVTERSFSGTITITE